MGFLSSSTVREMDAGVSPAISIHHLGNVGATKSERAGISKLKCDMKMVGPKHTGIKSVVADKYLQESSSYNTHFPHSYRYITSNIFLALFKKTNKTLSLKED